MYDEDKSLVPLDGNVVCYLRMLIERDVQAFYDDPYGVCYDPSTTLTLGTSIRMQYWQLRRACHQLKIDWDEVVQQEANPVEIKRMDELLESK